MDLDALADFVLVAGHGGLGKAARETGRSKATLSRKVAELEDSLQVRLVERGARTLKLTAEGEALLARTRGLLGEIVQAGDDIRSGGRALSGLLRISAPFSSRMSPSAGSRRRSPRSTRSLRSRSMPRTASSTRSRRAMTS